MTGDELIAGTGQNGQGKGQKWTLKHIKFAARHEIRALEFQGVRDHKQFSCRLRKLLEVLLGRHSLAS